MAGYPYPTPNGVASIVGTNVPAIFVWEASFYAAPLRQGSS